MKTVAVVVTYNSALHIGACLAALNATGATVRVVDNASTDGTVSVVRDSFPDVALIANRDNVGFSRAVNQGTFASALVDTDVVLLVNPDCVVAPGTVAGLVEHLGAHPEVGIAGPRILDTDGRSAVSAHPFESLLSVVLSRFGGNLIPVGLRRLASGARRRRAYDACQRGALSRVDWLSGACLAVRASLLRGIGGLDERYFLYYEDEELCLQAWRRGSEVVYLPELAATHVGGASSADVGATWPHLYRSMLIFFARHRRSTYQAVRAVVLLRALIGMSLAGVRVGLRRPTGRARGRAWHGVALVAWAGARRALTRNPAGGRQPA